MSNSNFQKAKIKHISWIILASFILLAGRMFYINQFKNEIYITMAQNQHFATIDQNQYGRGDFFDRYGRNLTSQNQTVLVEYNTAENNLETISSIEEIVENSKNFNSNNHFLLDLQPRYSKNPLAVHTIGYAGKANADEAKILKQYNIDSEYIGKTGLEYQYDQVLQGKISAKIGLPIDQFGNIMGEPRYLPAENSTNLNVQLTLDKDYQEIAETAMSNINGAVVVMEVATGDILAVVSSPSFDQNEGQISSDGDDYLNKAFAYYPPASIFKLVLALAALDNEISIDNTTQIQYDDFYCNGSITLYTGNTIHCWHKEGHGYEDLNSALANSCNPYFIALGQKLGGDLIEEYCYRLGLAEQNVIGYNTKSMANNIDFNHGVPADVANVSIGEKGIRLTPLLVAQLLATIGNDGKLVTPRLVSALLDNEGFIAESFPAKEGSQVVKASSAIELQKMLANAVKNGTGSPAGSDLVNIGGKTGTSQNFGVWFAGLAPINEPQLAISVYVADGESGGHDAGSVFKEIVENIAIFEGVEKNE